MQSFGILKIRFFPTIVAKVPWLFPTISLCDHNCLLTDYQVIKEFHKSCLYFKLSFQTLFFLSFSSVNATKCEKFFRTPDSLGGFHIIWGFAPHVGHKVVIGKKKNF